MNHTNLEAYSNNGEFNSFKNNSTIPKGKLINILFIGNSITTHAPSQELGWTLNCGMAAANPKKDYVHHLMEYLNTPESDVLIFNCAELERVQILNNQSLQKIQDALSENIITHAIIQLGDNIQNQEQLSSFFANMNFLLRELKSHKCNIFMTSTWWDSEAKNSIISHLCKIYDAKFIDISDLFMSPMNSDRSKVDYQNSGVDNHPKSWGMEQIAKRIYFAMAHK